MLYLLQNSPEGSVLLGVISYGKPSSEVSDQGNDPEKNPVSYKINYQVPPAKVNINIFDLFLSVVLSYFLFFPF